MFPLWTVSFAGLSLVRSIWSGLPWLTKIYHISLLNMKNADLSRILNQANSFYSSAVTAIIFKFSNRIQKRLVACFQTKSEVCYAREVTEHRLDWRAQTRFHVHSIQIVITNSKTVVKGPITNPEAKKTSNPLENFWLIRV